MASPTNHFSEHSSDEHSRYLNNNILPLSSSSSSSRYSSLPPPLVGYEYNTNNTSNTPYTFNQSWLQNLNTMDEKASFSNMDTNNNMSNKLNDDEMGDDDDMSSTTDSDKCENHFSSQLISPKQRSMHNNKSAMLEDTLFMQSLEKQIQHHQQLLPRSPVEDSSMEMDCRI